jgi:calcium-dependent protein kinase
VTLDCINSEHLNNGRIQDIYELSDKKIGEGAYGTIYSAVHKRTKSVRAVKKIPRKLLESYAAFQLEAGIMSCMKHPNIIEFHETFADEQYVYLVMELCEGGEVLDRIAKSGPLPEREAAMFMKQVFLAVEYMHSRGICHRDLKAENFLLKAAEPGEKSIVKLIDFGIARQFAPGVRMQTVAGTLSYQAPEVMNGYYTNSCDLWSCGVIMYTLLVGFPPFYAQSDAAIVKKIKAADFSFQHANWKRVSDDAKELIRSLLDKDPQARCTATQALATSWIRDAALNTKGHPGVNPAAGG